MRGKRWLQWVGVALCACSPPDTGAPEPGTVRLTWLSVSNWLLEAGDTRILLDGYVTRVDRRTVNADGTSTATSAIDTALLAHVADGVLPDRQLDWVLVGHGHWDHAWDTPGWGARGREGERVLEKRINGAMNPRLRSPSRSALSCESLAAARRSLRQGSAGPSGDRG